MIKTIFNILLISSMVSVTAQNVMTPEILIQLNKVSGKGISKDGKSIIYTVSKYNKELNSNSTKIYSKPLIGGEPIEIKEYISLLNNKKSSPNGNYIIKTEEIKLKNVEGSDFYNDVSNSNVQIYDALNYRHWDTWEDGAFSHILYKSTQIENDEFTDIMLNEPFDCPTKPFGGSEDYVWSPDSKSILYVAKKLSGTAYATSTNTDIYEYSLTSKTTKNLTEYNKGYDTQPAFSAKGQLAWLQMKRDGYEADKNDIIVKINNELVNLTETWNETVDSFVWQDKGEKIFFVAPTFGTMQLFEIQISNKKENKPKQLTEGQFDISGIVGQVNNTIIVGKRDMNHAIELYSVNLKTGEMTQITHENDAIYKSIELSKVEKRIVKTTDGKDMLTWVIYPPNFDSSKKYPTLLYCKGGPQGPLSQSYSYRWNYQLMAANGYIIVAPSRRGMSGFGIAWNEQISKDYGGLNMQDYLAAIDDLSTESFVDKNRLGCVGASYGGYSAFYLAAIHEGRFKSFIAHDGIFNWKSMYGTTEELFFVNWDLGGAYWDKENKVAQKSHTVFNPAERVQDWTAPIMVIQGGLDFRVPIGQGLEAFQAAQLQEIKSRLLYFPEENHWVLDYQNSLIWHSEFAKWLSETL